MGERAALATVRCKRECQVCCLCYKQEIGCLPGSSADVGGLVNDCPFCRLGENIRGVECCSEDIEAVTSCKNGHKVHVKCFVRERQCPVCRREEAGERDNQA